MKEIKELDNKYLVLKWDDINDLGWDICIAPFNDMIEAIKENRKADGKKDNRYVVLNLDDDIDLKYLRGRILNAFDRPMGSVWRFRVRDIAVDLVNAILKAKEE